MRSASRPSAHSRLTTAQRNRLPASSFALPERRALPLTDRKHIADAASRLSGMKHRGSVSPAEYRRARAAILRAEKQKGIAPRGSKLSARTPSGALLRNPLPVDRSYRRAGPLERDLTRYYEECSVSRSAARFRGKRHEDYCARVAWSRVKSTGRYPDYPGFTNEVAMARKRNARGQFSKRGGTKRRRPAARRSYRNTSPRPRRQPTSLQDEDGRVRRSRRTGRRS